ncbi:MAG: hypothetical protein KIT33_00320 [Candidatus Kapabacteria bacterium]|nr:hypothetical protein [Ignavibacteriota bacterium]MCW5883392.1 hypothetical protein [Candidatus Kapabacteria bacterium]
MNLHFYLDSKLSKSGEKAVILFIRGIEKGRTEYINAKIKVAPDLWNPEREIVRRNHPLSMEYNEYLT